MVETVRTPGTASEVERGRALVRRESADGIVRLTLARGDRYNPLSRDMIAALQAELDALAEDVTARVVVLAAEGRGFCAGHDMAEMRAHTDDPVWQNTLFAECNHLMTTLTRIPQPVIARVHGIATAAGCQLVAQCDLAVAVEEAKFAVSGVNYGLFCSTPSVPLLRNMLPKQAMEMLVTGEFISAQQALERGLVNRVVPADQLDAEIEKLVASILAKPRVALAMGKELFYRQRELGIEAAYQLANQTMAVNMMNECAIEGFTAFTEKRQPSWKPA
jgi:enoyl-CoA hydratase/carnithine racemase